MFKQSSVREFGGRVDSVQVAFGPFSEMVIKCIQDCDVRDGCQVGSFFRLLYTLGADMKYLSITDVSKQTGWCLAKIRALIRNGKLLAVNTSVGERPTYEIRDDDLNKLLTPIHPETSK